MTIADWCILIAILIPYVAAGMAKATPGFDNANPRDPNQFTGKALRAWNTQLNGFEVFPFFAIAVIFSEIHLVPQLWVNVLAVLFIVLRIVHFNVYLNDRPNVRTPVWSLAFLVTIILFILPSLLPFFVR